MKSYDSDFVPLGVGLNCLTAAGVECAKAKLQICQAINDRKLRYRGFSLVDETGIGVGLISRLQGCTVTPNGFDWESSAVAEPIPTAGLPIQVKRFEINADDFLALWAIDPRPQAEAPHSGEERGPYTTTYIKLLEGAIRELGITDDNQPKKDAVLEWFRRQRVDGRSLSENLSEVMATIVRKPEMQRGGAQRRRKRS